MVSRRRNARPCDWRRWLFTLTLSLGGTACIDWDDSVAPPTPGLAEHLVGTWKLIAWEGFHIPGWVRHCGWSEGCDSTFVTSGRLTFEVGSRCSRAVNFEPGTPPTVQPCSYHVGSNSASLVFEGVATPYEATVHRDQVTNDWHDTLILLGGRGCGPWEYGCSQSWENYEKTNP